RLGRRRAPVGEQRRLLLVDETDPADVAALAVAHVQAPEREPLLDRLELGDTVLVQRGERVALRAVLGRARRAGAADRGEARTGLAAQLVQPPVETVDDLLLARELAVDGCHPPAHPRSAGSRTR